MTDLQEIFNKELNHIEKYGKFISEIEQKYILEYWNGYKVLEKKDVIHIEKTFVFENDKNFKEIKFIVTGNSGWIEISIHKTPLIMLPITLIEKNEEILEKILISYS